jgi:hypothetical protein
MAIEYKEWIMEETSVEWLTETGMDVLGSWNTIHPDGKAWWVDGLLHREDGPAYTTTNGYEVWMVNGKPHRLDGPAFKFANGEKSWWIDGLDYLEDDWEYEKELWIQREMKDKIKDSII